MGKILDNYRPSKSDLKFNNPYLSEIEDIKNRLNESPDENSRSLYSYRDELIRKYAFSLPTLSVLKLIRKYSPLVEIGAGNGYWAFCLSNLGADIIAFDRYPPEEPLPWPWGDPAERNFWFENEWFDINPGDEKAAALHPQRTLFLCWPAFHNTMASDTLREYMAAGGRSLIYIGDTKSSGDWKFHQMLSRESLVLKRELWSWDGNREIMRIYNLDYPENETDNAIKNCPA